MSQSMRELRESSRLTRMGRRLSLMLSKESIFGSVSPKDKMSVGILSDSTEVSPGSSPSPSPLLPRRNTFGDGSPPTPPRLECRVYGVELQTAVSRSNTLHRDLPEVVYKCFVYLDQKGLDEEGIFRMSGSATDILKIKGQFNQGVSYDLSSCLNPHTISGLLKLFLRELPQPLFPTEIDTTENDLLGRLKAMIESLPKENKCLMGCLFILLNKVSKAEAITKMGIQNLVIVFSATLNCSGAILTKLIKHALDIFPVDLLSNTGILEQPPTPPQEPTQQQESIQQPLIQHTAPLRPLPQIPQQAHHQQGQQQQQQIPQQTKTEGAGVVIDLSTKTISVTDSTSKPMVAVAEEEEEDIFVIDDDKKKKKPESSLITTPNKERKLKKSAGDLKVKPIETSRRKDLRRQLTSSIFDSDDEDDDPNNTNDLLVPPSKSLPARARGFFLR